MIDKARRLVHEAGMQIAIAFMLYVSPSFASVDIYPDEIATSQLSVQAMERLARFVTPDHKKLRRFGACQDYLLDISLQRGRTLSDEEIMSLLPLALSRTGESLIDFPVRIMPDGSRRPATPDMSGDDL